MRNLNIFLSLLLTVTFSVSVTAAESEWKEYKSTHFVIFYKNAPKSFVKTVEENAEDYYDEISRDLGLTRYRNWNYNDRGKIYIYDDTEDYVESSRQAKWSHGVASPKDKVIRTFPSAHGFFDSTLPHELGHIIFREIIGFEADVPRWFEEGVAMYQEKAKRWGANQQVLQAISDDSFIPLDELSIVYLGRNSSKELVSLYYAQAASAVNYLIEEHGQYRFEQFCRHLKDGDPFEWALKKAYPHIRSLKKYNQAWINYLKE